MSLPIETVLPDLRRALNSHTAAVLEAPPGAGKTTLVPLALLDEPWLRGKRILMLEPRRLAARAAAARMAYLREEPLGGSVGYRIRFESRISQATRIAVLTEGILTRRLQGDPELNDVGLVIFDEFHERHLHADLALALTLDTQQGLRPDLRILIMSATLDGEAVAGILGAAPLIRSRGRSYPVDVRYLSRAPEGPLPSLVASAVRKALKEHEGDVLVFLPGAFEIRRTQHLLEEALGAAADVMPLYGDLPWELQQRAIEPAKARRRVVLATPIAETSLTIEGVRIVVDAGYVRVPEFDPRSGLTRLTTKRISRASSDQRRGRAGRTAPGVCYRLWTEADQQNLIPNSAPEIRGADLAPLALELAAWGVGDAASLSWLDPPPAGALAQARTVLVELDALDVEGRITPPGRAMAKWPLHPRLSHMLVEAEKLGLGTLACDVAALLSERDVLKGEARRSVDFSERLEALDSFRRHGRRREKALNVDLAACQRAVQAAAQYRRLLSVAEFCEPTEAATTGLLLALAYPDRVAQARAAGDVRYVLASGRGAHIHADDPMRKEPLIVAASVDAGETEGRIYLAAPVEEDALRQHLASHIQSVEVVRWDLREQAVVARREERFRALLLSLGPLAEPRPEKVRAAMLEGIRQLGIDALPWTPAARLWQARVACMRSWFPEENWPDISDEGLAGRLDAWLGPFLDGVSRRSHLSSLDMLAILRSGLDWAQLRRVDEDAPTHLQVPSGSRVKLDYRPGEPPVLAVKLQEMFGCADTPRIARGRIAVTLHLLSPARRPIQVTQDLRGFWERTYVEVKKEFKGRYPKHPWPDDPWTAVPTARTRKRT